MEWGADDKKSNFLYSGLEGVRNIGDGGEIEMKKKKMCTALQKPVEKSKQLTDWLKKVPEHSACDPPSRTKGVGNIAVDLAEHKYEEKLEIEYFGGVENYKDKTLTMKYSDQPKPQKKKVWTQLKNGLYGWRISRPLNTNQVNSQTRNLTERGPQSARAELYSKHESNPNLKRKLSLGGEISGESESFACR